ncbi:MAG: hypothetical protein DLM69_09200 [Candidatus Chloroheliales bacterium]|nr:MAG: hypothetical protein DLM69_09200 [Chloroflexota bacterium]
MNSYDLYLEVASDGRAMAHVLALLGCFTKADSSEAALDAVPQAVWDYWAWLGQHGENLAEPEGTTIQVVEVVEGFGPFQHGDKAALFTPEREPIGVTEMETYLRRWSFARADLLTLTPNVSDYLLDWQASVGEMSIRQILRHVGNTNEWYLSRLVNPATLPAQWESDDKLPIFRFLAMEQRTVTERMRKLTAKERAQVTYPTSWTDHPNEPWSARKVLRRMIEHEREHTEQIVQVLAQTIKRAEDKLAIAGPDWSKTSPRI